MDTYIEFRFFTKCAPQFFTDELLKSFEKSQETQDLTALLHNTELIIGSCKLLKEVCEKIEKSIS